MTRRREDQRDLLRPRAHVADTFAIDSTDTFNGHSMVQPVQRLGPVASLRGGMWWALDLRGFRWLRFNSTRRGLRSGLVRPALRVSLSNVGGLVETGPTGSTSPRRSRRGSPAGAGAGARTPGRRSRSHRATITTSSSGLMGLDDPELVRGRLHRRLRPQRRAGVRGRGREHHARPGRRRRIGRGVDGRHDVGRLLGRVLVASGPADTAGSRRSAGNRASAARPSRITRATTGRPRKLPGAGAAPAARTLSTVGNGANGADGRVLISWDTTDAVGIPSAEAFGAISRFSGGAYANQAPGGDLDKAPDVDGGRLCDVSRSAGTSGDGGFLTSIFKSFSTNPGIV
jgi:hypothetical protein